MKVDRADWGKNYPQSGDRQTSITQYGDSRDIWEIATTDPLLINKLDRKGIEPFEYEIAGVFCYRLENAQLSFRKPAKPREMTDEQRQASRERMQALHDARKAGGYDRTDGKTDENGVQT
jgi:hypothetical protein